MNKEINENEKNRSIDNKKEDLLMCAYYCSIFALNISAAVVCAVSFLHILPRFVDPPKFGSIEPIFILTFISSIVLLFMGVLIIMRKKFKHLFIVSLVINFVICCFSLNILAVQEYASLLPVFLMYLIASIVTIGFVCSSISTKYVNKSM